jgi:hypothetical protein
MSLKVIKLNSVILCMTLNMYVDYFYDAREPIDTILCIIMDEFRCSAKINDHIFWTSLTDW